MAINDPTQPQAPAGPDLNAWLTQMANKAVQDALLTGQQAITGQAAALDQRLTAVEGQIADALAKAAPGVIADAGAAGVAVLTNLETNPATQRDAALVVVAGVVVAAVAVLIAYLLGNPYAGKIIAGVPAAAAALVLWLSRVEGVKLPALGPKAPGA